MENLAKNWKETHVSATQVNTAISQLPCGGNAGKVTIWIQYEISWCSFLIHVNPCIMIMKILVKVPLDLDIHKTLIILRVNEHSWGKICTSVLLKNCSPFSIKIKVEYNTIQQIVNKYRKLLDLTIISKIFF